MKNLGKVFFVLVVVASLSLSSCKRGGYGCPYEMKMPKLGITK
jgi:hypothetical protein